ncbi:hypothetical protein MKX01_042521 [Papaver californicum]|nr:hypothetical protein MKX01_042521 [Papaver californicum]
MPRRKLRWTLPEEEALKSGVNKYGTGKWKNIMTDPEFGPCLVSRTNVDLKDKWRNIIGESSYRPKFKVVPTTTYSKTPSKSGFCNPADVEVYTEVKRQGKGADCVPSLIEIIDCFENSRKPDAGDEVNSGDESTMANTGASEGLVKISSKRSRGEMSVMMDNSCNGSLGASTKRNGSRYPIEVLVAAIESIDSHDLVRVSEEPTADTLVPDNPKENKLAGPNFVRKRSRDRHLQDYAIQKKAVKKFKSSMMVDLSNLETLMMAVNYVTKNDDDEVPTINRQIRKTVDGVVRDDAVSPVCLAACGSNGSSGDNLDTLADFIDIDIQICETLPLQSKADVAKKKRELSRKQIPRSWGVAASPDKESGLDVHANKSFFSSPNATENITKSYRKSGGGELNPLVNRVNPCMSKLPAKEKETHCSVDTEEKLSEVVLVNKSVSVSSGINLVLDDMSANSAENQSLGIRKLMSFELSILPERNILISDQSLGIKKLTSFNLDIPQGGNTDISVIKSSKVCSGCNEKVFSCINNDQRAHNRTAQQRAYTEKSCKEQCMLMSNAHVGNMRGCENQHTSDMTYKQQRLQKNFYWRERRQRLDAEAEAYILKDRQRQQSFLLQHSFMMQRSSTSSQQLQAPPAIWNQHVKRECQLLGHDTSVKVFSNGCTSYNEKGFAQTVCDRRAGQRAIQQRRRASMSAEKSAKKIEEHLCLLKRLRTRFFGQSDVGLGPISKLQV